MDPEKPQPHPKEQQPSEERPPLGSWPRMYTLVLANLALLIVIFYAFTRAFD
jgi:hypothetical protein